MDNALLGSVMSLVFSDDFYEKLEWQGKFFQKKIFFG